MGLNYLVKKLNEAKIEERLIRMLQKASRTQSTQVTGPLIAEETGGAIRFNSLKTIQQPSPPGISLVFNREENKRRSDPYSLIKPVIPRVSMETINIISPSDSVPLKRIESAHVAKTNSSHILTEKVFVKTNEYGNQAVNKTSSTAKSDCYVAQLITVKKNEYGHVSGLGAYSVARKRSNTSVLDSEIEDISLTSRGSTPSSHVQDERAEETPSKETIDVTEKVLFQNIYTSRIIRTKTSIVDITMEKQGVNNSKSNEEIDTGCSIKKSVESIISKIALNLKNKNEDPKKEKNAEDTLIAAKNSSSNTGSGRYVTEISSVEKEESRSIAAKDTSSPVEIDHVWENYPVQNIESQYINSSGCKSNRVEEDIESELTVAKKSSCSCIGRVDENFSIKKVESRNNAPKETTSIHSYSARTEDNIPVKKVESGHFDTKETTSSYSKDDRVGENIQAKMVESGHIATKETTSSYSKDDRVGENIQAKMVESGHLGTKETPSSYSKDDRVGENIQAKKAESGHIATKETTSTHSHSEFAVDIDNTPVKKVGPGQFATKETTSVHSLERVGKNIMIKKVELGLIAAKETTSPHSKHDRVGENVPVKRSESEHIAAKETILYAGINPPKQEIVSVKKSVTLIESRRDGSEKSSSILPTNYKTREYAAIKKSDSGRNTKKTVPHTRSNPLLTAPGATDQTRAKESPFQIQSGITVRKKSIKKQKTAPFPPIATKETRNTRIDDNIAESSVVKINKAAHNAVKAKHSKEFVLEMKKEDIESDNSIKKTEDGTVNSSTSKTTNDPDEQEVEEPSKSLTDKIKELLEDEDIVELKLYKPSPSSKK